MNATTTAAPAATHPSPIFVGNEPPRLDVVIQSRPELAPWFDAISTRVFELAERHLSPHGKIILQQPEFLMLSKREQGQILLHVLVLWSISKKCSSEKRQRMYEAVSSEVPDSADYLFTDPRTQRFVGLFLRMIARTVKVRRNIALTTGGSC